VDDILTSINRTGAWRAFGMVSAVVLYAVSVSGRVYNLTTPVTLPHHELLRKTLAVLAFALLGFAFQRSRVLGMRGILAAGIVLACYSYAIELGQITIKHVAETFADHSFDVASGLGGGALGAFLSLFIEERHARARRTEAVVIVLFFVALAWFFSVTYARLD
jgi:hypothetical protein